MKLLYVHYLQTPTMIPFNTRLQVIYKLLKLPLKAIDSSTK
ncbi:MAG: hypothetical protein ACI9ES_000064, partial [Oceanospirillaceae bacterium]